MEKQAAQISYDDMLEYLNRWRDDEGWDALNIILNAGAIGMAADYLASAGAIDSRLCYPEYQAIEAAIETEAAAYRKLSEGCKAKLRTEVFQDCYAYHCKDCGYVSFVNDDNEKLYAEELTTCWQCDSNNIQHDTM